MIADKLKQTIEDVLMSGVDVDSIGDLLMLRMVVDGIDDAIEIDSVEHAINQGIFYNYKREALDKSLRQALEEQIGIGDPIKFLEEELPKLLNGRALAQRPTEQIIEPPETADGVEIVRGMKVMDGIRLCEVADIRTIYCEQDLSLDDPHEQWIELPFGYLKRLVYARYDLQKEIQEGHPVGVWSAPCLIKFWEALTVDGYTQESKDGKANKDQD